MSFFNKKEEVLKIELTDYGREQLTKGIFRPEYYSFFDNDIIYNSSCAGVLELQNETEERILNESFTIKPQTMVRAKPDDSPLGLSDPNLLAALLGEPIGLSDSNNQYMPAWNINFLNGEIDSINTGSEIPQIILKESFVDIIIDTDFKNATFDNNETILLTPKQGGDDSYVKFKNNSVIVSIEEKNVESIGENFEIQVFFNDQTETLNFYNSSINNFNIVNDQNILLDTSEEDTQIYRTDPTLSSFFNKDQNNLELYFNFSSDGSIAASEFIPTPLFIYDTIAGGNITPTQALQGVSQPLTADNGIGNNQGEVCN